MYHHKLCSATYLPLDIGQPQGANIHERPPSHSWSTESCRELRSPSLKISEFLRQKQPTRSASVLFRRNPKAVNIGHGRTPASQSPPSHPSRFPSAKRTLLPAFSSPRQGKSKDIEVEKPLPSEPIVEIDKLLRGPVAPTRPSTAASVPKSRPPASGMSVRSFTRGILEAETASVRSPFILQTIPSKHNDLKCLCSSAGLLCTEMRTLSAYKNPKASANIVEDQYKLDRRSGCCSGEEEDQLGFASVSPSLSRLNSSRKWLSESRKRCRGASRKMSDSTPVQGEAGSLSRCAGGTGWMRDAPLSSLVGSGSSETTAETSRSRPQDKAKEHSSHETYGTGIPLIAVTAVNPGRPKLVTISRRCSNAGSSNTAIKPSTPQQSTKLVSAFSPETPPDTPEDINYLEETREIAAIRATTQKILESRAVHAAQMMTPPRSPSLSSSGTRSRNINRKVSISVPGVFSPKRQPSRFITAKHLPWVLFQLEESIASFPLTLLQPDSPVIIELRRQRHSLFPCPNTPQTSPFTPRPRSSRFIPPPNRNSSLHFSSRRYHNEYYHQSEDLDESHLQPLRSIFPTTTDFFRSSLYATLLALNHLSDLASSFPPSSQQYSLNIPDKAKVRLGIRFLMLTSASLERSQMRARIEKAQEGLQMCAGRLTEAICGYGLGKGDEALLSAVGEVVRMSP
ncbi:MAG: hypothetical protein M1830_006562 [Pleopsidium flavum]|nr:MAG: hypothetical protein M1830_006562 [Pleopsidium flavum]